jgi:hypothetical protein
MLGAQMQGRGEIGGVQLEPTVRTDVKTGTGYVGHGGDRCAASGLVDGMPVEGSIRIAAFDHADAFGLAVLDCVGVVHGEHHGDDGEQQGQQPSMKSCGHSIPSIAAAVAA